MAPKERYNNYDLFLRQLQCLTCPNSQFPQPTRCQIKLDSRHFYISPSETTIGQSKGDKRRSSRTIHVSARFNHVPSQLGSDLISSSISRCATEICCVHTITALLITNASSTVSAAPRITDARALAARRLQLVSHLVLEPIQLSVSTVHEKN